jgi:hypothetical protein
VLVNDKKLWLQGTSGENYVFPAPLSSSFKGMASCQAKKILWDFKRLKLRFLSVIQHGINALKKIAWHEYRKPRSAQTKEHYGSIPAYNTQHGFKSSS